MRTNLNLCLLSPFLPWHSYGKLDTAEVARGIGAILKTPQIQNRPTCFMLPNYYVHDGRSVCQKIFRPNCQFLRLDMSLLSVLITMKQLHRSITSHSTFAWMV